MSDPVNSVAGRTGNVILTVNDIVGFDNANFANTAYVDLQLNAIVGGAPGALQTLANLANALNDGSNIASVIINDITLLQANDAVQSGNIRTLQNQVTALQLGNAAVTGRVTSLETANTVQYAAISSISTTITNMLNGTAQFQDLVTVGNGIYNLGSEIHQWKYGYFTDKIFLGGHQLTVDYYGNLRIDGHLVATGNVNLDLSNYSGNIVPSTNRRYTIGNVNYQWHSLFVSNTVYIGGTSLTISNGNLLVNGNVITGSGGTANTGNIVFNGTSIALDAGKVAAASTVLELSPNAEGWAYLQLPNDISGNIYNTRLHNDAGNVEIGTGDSSHGGPGYTWTFGRDGLTRFPSGLRFPGQYSDIVTANVGIDNKDIDIYTNEWMGGGVEVYLEHDSRVSIQTNNGGYIWGFDKYGNLTLPHNSRITEVPSPVPGNYALSLSGTGAVSPDQQLLIYPTSIDANHLHLTTGNLYNTELFFGNDDLFVKLSNIGDIVVNTNNNQGNTAQWTFGADGTLTTPGTVKTNLISSRAAGQRVTIDPDGTNLSYIRVDGFDDGGERIVISNQFTNSLGMYFYTENGTFRMYQNMLGFPDSTWQTTAFSNAAIDTYLVAETVKNIHGNVTIFGNLFVNGSTTTISTNNYVISDNIVNFANANPADSLDIGFVGHRTPSGQPLQHTGLVRDASANQWKLFSNVTQNPGATVDFTDAVYDDLQVGNITSPTITAINANIAAANAAIAFANTIQSQQIAAANVGMKGYVDSQTFYSNARVATYLQYGNIANISAAGNVTATYFIGNGALLTGIAASSSYSNVQVATYLPTYSGNLSAGGYFGMAGADGTTVVDFQTGAATNQIITLSSNYTFSIKAGAAASNRGSLVLESGQNSRVRINGNGSNVLITAGNGTQSSTWIFANSGVLTFPDGTTQTTAASGGGSNYSNSNVASYLVTYTGNLSAGNANIISNLTVGSYLTTSGTGGNISGVNYYLGNTAIITSNVYVSSGNVTAQYLFGNGSQLTGIPSSYSNVQVATYLATGLSSNIVVGTGAFFVGNVSATTTMQYSSGQGGLLFTKLVGGTGAAIYSLNVTPSAQNYALSTNGASLNLNAPTGGGVYTSINNTLVTSLTAGYLNVAGNVSAANVSAQYLFGDGSNLTNMYSNVNVTNYLPSHTGNVGVNYLLGTTPNVILTAGTFNSTFDTLGNVSMPNVYVTGNVIAGYFIGNGSLLTGLPSSYSNTQTAAYLNTMGYNLYSNVNVAAYMPTYLSSYTGNITAQNITVSGNINLTGNILQINSAVFYGNVGTGFSALYAGAPGYTQLPQVVAQFTTNYNGYAQLNSQNLGVGNQASTDFVATANNGNDSAYFVDLGIAGNGYDPAVGANNNALGTVLSANDAYLYTAGNTAVNVGGNLVIGVQTQNKNIKFFAGGVNANNVVLTIANTGITTSNVTADYLIASGQFLTSLPGYAYSNVNVKAYTESMGFQNYGNVNVAALITTNGLTNYSNVNVAAYAQTQGYTNYSNVNAAAFTSGLTNYSNVNTAAYLNSQGYNLYSNVNVIAYLAGNITVGNVTATYFTGNGAFLTGLPAGYSNVQTAAYLNATGYNLYSNVNVAAYLSTATINTTGNITAAYISGNISVTGNVTGTSPNVTIQAGSYSSVFDNQGNVTVPRLFANGNIQSTGYVFGNGAFLTGVVTGSSYSNVQVATYLPTYSGNIANVRLGVSGVLTFPDGTTQITAATGGGSSYSNVNVAAYISTYTGNLSAGNANIISNLTVGSYISTSGTGGNISGVNFYLGNLAILTGNITASSFIGSGIYLSALPGYAYSNVNVIAYLNATGYNLYSNVNVAAYLTTYGGAIQSSNVQTTTANIQALTASTNNATGALRVMGGAGIRGNLNVGSLDIPGALHTIVGNVSVTGAGTEYFNIGGNVMAIQGSFGSINATGAINTTGNVLAASIVGTLATASQTGITAVGTLATLTVSGNATVGNLVGVEANTRIIANNYVSTFDIYGNVTFPGNVIATRFIGDGSLLTGIAGGGTNYSNVNVAAYLNTQGYNLYSNVNVASYLGTGQITVANLKLAPSGNIVFADGTTQTTAGINNNYGNVNVASYLGAMNPVKLGSGAGATSQGTDAVAIGRDAGKQQGTEAVAIGVIAGQTNQGNWGVAIGSSAGASNQGARAVAIGVQAAEVTQGVGAVALGAYAGDNNQGQYAIAVGYQAGPLNQPQNSIILNASGSTLNVSNSGLYVNPVRNDLANVANVIYYNAATNELTYAPASAIYSNVQVATYLPTYSGNISSGNVTTIGNVTASYLVGTQVGNSVGTTATYTGNISAGNVSVTGNVTAGYLVGIHVGNAVGTTATYTGNVNAAYFIGNIASSPSGNLNVVGNLISTGYGFFPGAYNESATTSGVFIGNTGSGTPTPRIGFYNGNVTQNWQVDNYFGQFRWFTPGITQMTLDPTGSLSVTNATVTTLTATGNANVAGTGGISIPNRPAFRVTGQGSSQTTGANLTSSNWTVDYTQGNSAAYLNGTNGTFTAPVAGLYQTSLTARTSTNTNASIIQAVIYQIKGGTQTVALMIEWGPNTSFNHASGSTTVKLAAGDKLYVTCTANGGGSGFSFDGNDHWDVVYLG